MNRKFISLALICAIYQQLQANPTGFSVVAGDAKQPYVDNSGATVVESGKKAVIEWDTFSIQQNEVFRFAQKGTKSAVLNRVTGSELSSILGTLKSNGKVFLVNPQGIVVGQNGLVQTAGFVASTADISNTAFLNDLNLTLKNFGVGQIINLGTINCSNGDVGLFARTVKNDGLISALAGSVFLGAGPQILLKPDGTQHLFISVDPEDDFVPSVENNGTIQALTAELKTGSNIYEKAISHTGKIQASYLNTDGSRVFLTSEQGRIEVSGEISALGGTLDLNAKDIHFTKSSRVDVSSSSGNAGSVMVRASRTAAFEGLIDGQADAGTGGFVHFAADTLHYTGNANLQSASGPAGHLILDPKFINIVSSGTDPIAGNSLFTDNPCGVSNISPATITAALATGSVTLEANTDINVLENIIAFTFNDLILEAGRSIIVDNGVGIVHPGSFFGTINASGAIPEFRDPTTALNPTQFWLKPGALISTSSNITIQPGNFCPGTVVAAAPAPNCPGFAPAPAPAPGCPAIGQILLDTGSEISATGNVTLIGVANPGLGAPSVLMNGSIVAADGDVFILGDQTTTPSTNNGVSMQNGAEVSDGLGRIDIIGIGNGDGTSSSVGVLIDNGSFITSSGGGLVNIVGTGGNGNVRDFGVQVSGTNSAVLSSLGGITITGIGGASIVGQAYGIDIESQGLVETSSGGHITLTGTGGSGASSGANLGINMSGNSTSVTSDTGNISLTGTGRGADDDNDGINVQNQANISTGGQGTIIFEGTGSADGTNGNIGINITSSATISNEEGGIGFLGTGKGTGNRNHGIVIFRGPTISSTGVIVFNGFGSVDGTDINEGITISSTNISTPSCITMVGIGGGTGVGSDNIGIDLENITLPGVGTPSEPCPPVPPPISPVLNCPAPLISIHGIGGNGTDGNIGVFIDNTIINSTGSKAIEITGEGTGTATGNTGVAILDSSNINSTCFGQIIITGTSGAGTFNNDGVNLDSSSINTVNGGVLVAGTSLGTTGPNKGVSFSNASFNTTGTGVIGLNGHGNTTTQGTDFCLGVKGVTSTFTSTTLGGLGMSGTGFGVNSNNIGTSLDNCSFTSSGNQILLIGVGSPGVSSNIGTYIHNTSIFSSWNDPTAIQILGNGDGSGNSNTGIFLDTGTTISAVGNAAVSLTGQGSIAGLSSNAGILCSDAQVGSDNGQIAFIGHSGGNGDNNNGILLENGNLITSNTGLIGLQGDTSTTCQNNNNGTLFGSGGSSLISQNGQIGISGQANGTGDSNIGLRMESGSIVKELGSGISNIFGVGSPNSTLNSYGILIEGPFTFIESTDGDLTFACKSNGDPTANPAFWIRNAANIKATGTSLITIEAIDNGDVIVDP